jgi:hypothetical protein
VKPVTPAIALGVCAGAVALAVVVMAARQHPTNARATKLDRFCAITKMTIHDDHSALASGDADRQREAAKRFWTREIYQGADSVAYCLAESEVPQIPLACPVLEDEKERWKCLADFAARVDQALP